MPNRRREPRFSVKKRARIYRNSADEGIDCVVRNLSASGARLRFQTAPNLTDSFVLFLASGNHQVPAHLAWRDGERVGVRFSKRLGWLFRRNIVGGDAMRERKRHIAN